MAGSESPQKHEGMSGIKPTGERFLPWANDPMCAYEHLHRYAYIARYAKGKRVLDLASGEGYGTAMLAQVASLAIGIDIDKKTVRHASDKYPASNLRFILGSITDIPLTTRFDVIVCFEAIEHIHAHKKLLGEVKRLLAPDGLFIVSTPNKAEYRIQESRNPFHVKELYFAEFKTLLTNNFSQVRFLGQRVYCGSSLWPCETKQTGAVPDVFIDRSASEFIVSESAQQTPLYHIGIASDAAIPDFPSEFLLDSSNALLREEARVRHEMEATIRSQEQALAWRESQIEDLRAQVDSIKTGQAWRFIQMFLRIRDFAFPTLSRRRRIYRRLVHTIHFF